MRVLLIEPDSTLSRTIALFLRAEGFFVLPTDLGEEGVDFARRDGFDAIISERCAPDLPGKEMIKVIRSAGCNTPVVVLTGLSSIDDEATALDAGADDFIRKPFHRDVLVSRVRAVARRAAGHAMSLLTVGGITVDVAEKRVRVLDRPVHLTGKEYQLIEAMALRPGHTFSKEAFADHLYGGRDEPELKIIDVFICRMRRKFEALGAPRQIETVWGQIGRAHV